MSECIGRRSSELRWRWLESSSSQPVNAQRMGNLLRCVTYKKGGLNMLLLIVLALLAIILFGVGFTVHWLFIVAIIAALLFVISFFVGGAGGRSRRAWW